MQFSRYANLYRQLLAFQIKRERLRKNLGGQAGLVETWILTMLQADPDLRPKVITRALNLERSSVSRALSKLEARGFIQSATANNDQRRKKIALTRRGIEAVRAANELHETIVSICAKELSTEEESELAYFFGVLADGLSALSGEAPKNIRPLALQIRRAAQALRQAETTHSSGHLSLIQVHILREMQAAEAPPTAKEIAESLPFDASTISRQITRLVARKLVRRVRSEEDKRRYELHLLPAAREAFEKHHLEIGECLHAALKGLSARDVDRFVQLTQRVVKEPPAMSAIVQELVEVREVKSESERRTARGFLIEQLVRRGEHYQLPDRILSAEDMVFGLYVNGKLNGICEVGRKGRGWAIRRQGLLPEVENSDFHRKFIAAVEKACSSITGRPPAADSTTSLHTRRGRRQEAVQS